MLCLLSYAALGLLGPTLHLSRRAPAVRMSEEVDWREMRARCQRGRARHGFYV